MRGCFPTGVRHFLAFLCLVAIGKTADALVPKIIFSNVATSSTSAVPGMPGLLFKAGNDWFDTPQLSPHGLRWVIRCFNNSSASTDDMVIAGFGTSGIGAYVVAQEGSPAPGLAGFLYEGFKPGCAINDFGHVAFSADTNFLTTSDDVVYFRNSNVGSYDIYARESEQAIGNPVGIGYGNANDSCNLTNSNSLFFRSAVLTGTSSSHAIFEMTGVGAGNVNAQTSLSAPANQLFFPIQSLQGILTDRVVVDATGQNIIYAGDLLGVSLTDFVVVKNGSVLIQEGAVIPGSNFVSPVMQENTAASPRLSRYNGHFGLTGSNQDSQDWVLVDGNVVARTGGLVKLNSNESFADNIYSPTFFCCAVNSQGDYVIGGQTNSSDSERDMVLVLNGETEILRESDPVDLNGDGSINDNAFIWRIDPHSLTLSDYGQLFLTVSLKNQFGTRIGQAFVVIKLPLEYALTEYVVNFGIEMTTPSTGRLQSADSETVQLCLNLDQEDPAPVQIEVSSTVAVNHPAPLIMTTVCRAEASDREIYTEFFNYSLGDWVGVPSIPITASDAIYFFQAPGSAMNYINPLNGGVQSRITGLLGAADQPTLPCWDFNSVTWN